MAADLTEEEAEAYRKDLQETPDRLRKQIAGLKASVSGISGVNPPGRRTAVRRRTGSGFSVMREPAGKYEQDIRDPENAHVT